MPGESSLSVSVFPAREKRYKYLLLSQLFCDFPFFLLSPPFSFFHNSYTIQLLYPPLMLATCGYLEYKIYLPPFYRQYINAIIRTSIFRSYRHFLAWARYWSSRKTRLQSYWLGSLGFIKYNKVPLSGTIYKKPREWSTPFWNCF